METITKKDKHGRTRNWTVKICLGCNEHFECRQGFDQKYCNRKCYSEAQSNRVIVNCAQCGATLERTPSDLKLSRSGLYFCDRKCKEEAQRIGGLDAIQPDHYGTGESVYADIAKRLYGCKCKDCSFSFESLLEVHHIDGDRRNNDPSNLEVLCPNHHRMRHLRLQDGRWRYSSSSVTPRDKLEELIKQLGL